MKEKTLGIIKPDATERNLIGSVIKKIEDSGLEIVELKRLSLSKEEARLFYQEHDGKVFFEGLVTFMTRNPIVVFVMEGENAIERYRKIMGATNPENATEGTIRKEFAKNVEENTVHGSDSVASAAREINFFFNS